MKKRGIQNIIYSLILVLYPMVRVGFGLSVIDTTYSPANFLFFKEMSGTWTIATYLANALGHLFTIMPGGGSLLGLNIYTSLVVGATALIPFIFLQKKIGNHILFTGEILALGLCWCPTTVLYNYLTYFLLTLGAMLLYRAVTEDDRRCFYAAGAALGFNVLTRLPNVTEAAFIVVVWFAAYIRRSGFKEGLSNTMRCIAGYLAGFLIPWGILTIRFSPGAYFEMIHNMFAMTDKAVDYKPAAMITAMFEDYIYAGRWIVFWLLGCVCVAGTVLLTLNLSASANGGKNGRTVFTPGHIPAVAVPICIMALVIRICYGRGMFGLSYYEYRSMYFWAVILQLFATILCIACMGERGCRIILRVAPAGIPDAYGAYREADSDDRLTDCRILVLLALIMIYITCIGSNNGLYPIVNNLFIVAPVVLWIVIGGIKNSIPKRADVSPAAEYPEESLGGSRDPAERIVRSLSVALFITTGVLFAGTLIQSVGFHFSFAFGDGIYGEPRDAYVNGYDRTAGIRTTSANAESLQGLMDHMYSIKTDGDTLITYGDIPGMGYLLDMPSALTTFWPDLDSYNYSEWKRDMDAVFAPGQYGENLPVIVVTLPVAAWESGDDAAIDYFGIDRDEYAADTKLNDLVKVIRDCGYTQEYSNDAYSVYVCRQRDQAVGPDPE